MAQKPTKSLQENILTLLCHNEEYGKVVATLIEADYFEGDYRTIATPAIEYWKKYKTPPGDHTPDLVAKILDDPNNRRAPTFRHILSEMRELATKLEPRYIVDQIRAFIRLQKLKSAIHQSAEQLNAHAEMAIEDVERIWSEMLKTSREGDYQVGSRLSEWRKVVEYLEVGQNEFLTGIAELDRGRIVPQRGTSTLLIGGTGVGKSWALIHYGKQALLQRKRVAHFTLEMGEPQTMTRYYQALFSAGKRDAVDKDIAVSRLKRDREGHLDDIVESSMRPRFALEGKNAGLELEQHASQFGSRLDNLIVKRIANLTVDRLAAELDMLEHRENFIPDLVILDYFGLMNVSSRDFRLSLGAAYRDWRALLIERNTAGVTAQQASKAGSLAKLVRPQHAAEDWSLIATSDYVLTLSQTKLEKALKLMRMYVGKGRDEQDQFGLIVTQNYQLGQFALQSAPLRKSYFEILDEVETDEPEDEE